MEPHAGMHVRVDTRLERLADELAVMLAAEPLDPFAREIIIVQSQGMRHWLTRRLAQRLGVATAMDMPFPDLFCRQLAAGMEGLSPAEARQPSAFDRAVLVWRLFALMDHLPDDGCFALLRQYVDPERDPTLVRRWQFCSRLAALFDNYAMYRPELLALWEEGGVWRDGEEPPHAAWQAALWRMVCEGAPGERHAGRTLSEVAAGLEGQKPDFLPQRIHVFGINSLPPVFLDMLAGVSHHIPVTIHVVSAARRPPDGEPDHPLLESMARLGADFFGLLHQRAASWTELSDPPPAGETLLGALQGGILAREAVPAARYRIAEDDDSLLIHDCHSPMREMEVLRDVLLDAFGRDPTLRPHDVAVLVPDMAAYAPFIEAVFSRPVPVPGKGEFHWPFHIADRAPGAACPGAGALDAILRLADARLTASEITGLLEYAPIRRRAGIAADEVAEIRGWIRDAHIRWGLDASDPDHPSAMHTWRAGIDRLLSGFAMGDVHAIINGVVPAGDVARANPALLGRFARWLDILAGQLGRLMAERSLAAWHRDLHGLLDALCAWDARDDGDMRARAAVRAVLEPLPAWQEHAGGERNIGLPVIRSALGQAMGDDGFGSGFLTGRITFCAMKPMRTIPFRIMAICGLQNGAFPRKDRPDPFDLQTAAPRPGDRSLRADDRQTFLDHLLAARERLILTYPGRSEKDNSLRASSVCLSELVDWLERLGVTELNTSIRDRVTVTHPLQPFSPEYRKGRPFLFAYGDGTGRDVPPIGEASAVAVPFVESEALSEAAVLSDGGEVAEVPLSDLIAAWTNPCMLYCTRTLGIRLAAGEEALCDAEPAGVDGLERYAMEATLFGARLRGVVPSPDEREILAAKGLLPPAFLAHASYAKLRRSPELLAAACRDAAPEAPREFCVEIPHMRITGRVDTLTAEGGCLQARCAKVKAKDRVRAWITQVFLNAAGEARGTRLLGFDGDGQVAEIRCDALCPDRSRAVLEVLAEGYRQALAAPQPFFPETSLAASKGTQYRLAWEGSDFDGASRGERDDPYVSLCFRGNDLLENPAVEARFLHLASAFWGALEPPAPEASDRASDARPRRRAKKPGETA